jgi:hypothetical protein
VDVDVAGTVQGEGEDDEGRMDGSWKEEDAGIVVESLCESRGEDVEGDGSTGSALVDELRRERKPERFEAGRDEREAEDKQRRIEGKGRRVMTVEDAGRAVISAGKVRAGQERERGRRRRRRKREGEEGERTCPFQSDHRN